MRVKTPDRRCGDQSTSKEDVIPYGAVSLQEEENSQGSRAILLRLGLVKLVETKFDARYKFVQAFSRAQDLVIAFFTLMSRE